MWCGAPCTVWHANPGKGRLRIHNWPSEIFSLQFCQAMTLVDPLSSPVMQTSSRWWQFAIRLRQRFPLSLTHWLEFEVLLSGGHTHQHRKLSLWSVIYLMFLSLMLLAGRWLSFMGICTRTSLSSTPLPVGLLCSYHRQFVSLSLPQTQWHHVSV